VGERILNSLTEIIGLDELIAREHIEREQMDRSSDDFITSMRNPNTVRKPTAR